MSFQKPCLHANVEDLQLFLNKIDLFKVKLPKVPLEKYFPEYTGGADVNKAAKYILWRFTQLNRARLAIYPQSVCPSFSLDDSLLTCASPQPHASDRYRQHPTSLRCSQRNDIAECATGLWDIMTASDV